MARPQKSGLDYFPLDVNIDQDDKIMLIESEFGVVGFGIVVKMLCKIYANGYFYEWGEKEQLLFSKRINVDINEVIACINSAIKWELFDKDVFNKYKVLTSRGIQKRYLEAIGRRKTLDIIQNYWLIEIPESEKMTINLINVDINEVNVGINPNNNVVIVDINSQSKVKKSKEKKSILNESNIDDESTSNSSSSSSKKTSKHKYGNYKNVLLTDEEHQKLLTQYGPINLETIIKYLDEYIEMKGPKYKSHYLVILKWGAEAALKNSGDRKSVV